MRYTPDTPRTARQDPGANRLDGFDCELPDDALDELLAPKRPRILGRPSSAPDRRRMIILAVLVLVLLVAGVVVALWSWQRPAVAPAVQPEAMPTATPIATLSSAARVWLGAPTVTVRRAELVPITIKRATLMRLPSQELGVLKWYPLPDVWGGGRVLARYCGTVERFSEIPPNPVPGDLWNVSETNASWVYCIPTGYDHAVWIDP